MRTAVAPTPSPANTYCSRTRAHLRRRREHPEHHAYGLSLHGSRRRVRHRVEPVSRDRAPTRCSSSRSLRSHESPRAVAQWAILRWMRPSSAVARERLAKLDPKLLAGSRRSSARSSVRGSTVTRGSASRTPSSTTTPSRRWRSVFVKTLGVDRRTPRRAGRVRRPRPDRRGAPRSAGRHGRH